jgi:hypothetical protein
MFTTAASKEALRLFLSQDALNAELNGLDHSGNLFQSVSERCGLDVPSFFTAIG